MRSDIQRWDNKYTSLTYTPRFTPDPLLLAHAELLTGRGRSLDVACGTGDNALYLAQRGYISYGVDGSIEGLRLCQRKAIDNQLAVTLFVADLEHLSLPGNSFDVIVVMSYLDRERISLLKRTLRPEGLLVFKTFNQNFLKEKPSFPRAYVLDAGELKAWFKNWRCVATNDSADNADCFTYWLGYRTL